MENNLPPQNNGIDVGSNKNEINIEKKEEYFKNRNNQNDFSENKIANQENSDPSAKEDKTVFNSEIKIEKNNNQDHVNTSNVSSAISSATNRPAVNATQFKKQPQTDKTKQAQQGNGTQSNIPKKAESKAKKKNRKKEIGITIGFLAGVLCVCLLLTAGLTISDKITKQQVKDPALLPAITIQDPPEDANSLTTTEIAKKVEPSIVTVNIYEKGSLSIFGTGSGVIFSEDGYILTNAHVVEDAYAIRIVLNDGTGYTANLVGVDSQNDLAVLKISAEGLAPASFGNSDDLQMGERVIAVGNPMGIFPGSTTQGVISGLNRQVPTTFSDGSTGYLTLIQTDAAINPGNSGGALVNSYGQVIGINVAKISVTSIENIGFAIPSNLAANATSLIFEEREVVETSAIGVTFAELNETNGPAEGLPSSGLYIEDISEYSDLYHSDVMGIGDVVTAINGQTVTTLDQARQIILQVPAGQEVELSGYDPQNETEISEKIKVYPSSHFAQETTDSEAEE